MTLGEKIRKLRHTNKMTLQDVAGATGYSKALISRIENDSVSPSINSLVKITSALGISLHELFSAVESNKPYLIKKTGRSTRTMPGGRIRVEGLSSDSADNKLKAVLITFEAGADVTDGRLQTHPGEEWWHVLRGQLEASVGDIQYELSEGDSIYLNSSSPHELRNPAKTKSTALVLVAT